MAACQKRDKSLQDICDSLKTGRAGQLLRVNLWGRRAMAEAISLPERRFQIKTPAAMMIFFGRARLNPNTCSGTVLSRQY